jgi:predicted porin
VDNASLNSLHLGGVFKAAGNGSHITYKPMRSLTIMQKKLIALAIAAAFSAPAFADTTVYGLVDAGYGSVSNTATPAGGGSSSKTTESGTAFSQNQTSRVGVKSTEDLGDGMKATFQLEMGLSSNPASDANFGGALAGGKGFAPNATIGPDRVLTVGLDLGQGTNVLIGKLSSPLRGIVYGNDAQYGSNLIGNLVTMDPSLTARAVAIAAIHNFGPVTGSFAILNNTIKTDGIADIQNGNGFEATAVFKQDMLSVSGGYRSTKSTTVTALSTPLAATDETTKDLILAANFDFGMGKVYGQYATVTVDTAIPAAIASDKTTYFTGGVNVPFTPTLAGYVELSSGKDDFGGPDSMKAKGYGLGVKYDLSKATSAYAHYGSMKLDETPSTAGSKVEQLALGMMHSF